MFGMIEEVYITYLIDFSKSAQLSTFFVSRKKKKKQGLSFPCFKYCIRHFDLLITW